MKHLVLLIFTCISLLGDSLYVKNVGEVDLGVYEKKRLFLSSAVKEIYYNRSKFRIIVRLHKAYYMYCGIYVDDVLNWVASKTLGKYYNKNIKGKYKCH